MSHFSWRNIANSLTEQLGQKILQISGCWRITGNSEVLCLQSRICGNFGSDGAIAASNVTMSID
jgi:hypothetical protein